ncbi:MAG: hypothetical protein AB1611_19605 [bacterium]
MAREKKTEVNHREAVFLNTSNKKGPCAFLVEIKLVKNGREYDIPNALVQAVGQLNIYTVDLGIVLIFDDGRGKDIGWRGCPEGNLINTLISTYPNLWPFSSWL